MRFPFRGDSAARWALLASLPKGAVGVEVGVWKGKFSKGLLRATSPKVLHLIDPWLVSEESDRKDRALYGSAKITQEQMDDIFAGVMRRFRRQIDSGKVVVHRETSSTAMTAMAPGSVDYVYIDGDHSYEAVVEDLRQAFRITRAGGMICCDDYLIKGWWTDGVVRAVNEFLAANPVAIHRKIRSQIMIRKLD